MSTHFEIKKDVTQKFTVNGRNYDSLDEVPAEYRTAIEKAIDSAPTTSTITINGRTYASVDDVPAPYRALLRGITGMAMRRVDVPPALRPEPIVSMRVVVIAVACIALAIWIGSIVF